jgi:hypothetical protein
MQRRQQQGAPPRNHGARRADGRSGLRMSRSFSLWHHRRAGRTDGIFVRAIGISMEIIEAYAVWQNEPAAPGAGDRGFVPGGLGSGFFPCGFGGLDWGDGKGKEGKSLLFVNKKKQKNFFLRLRRHWGSPIDTRREQMDNPFPREPEKAKASGSRASVFFF